MPGRINRQLKLPPSLRLGLSFLCLCLCVCTGIAPARGKTDPADPDLSQLVRQVQGSYTTSDLQQAQADLTAAAEQFTLQADWQSLAVVLTNLGRVQYAAGQLNPALETWEQAIGLYQERLNNRSAASALQILQAEALKELGLYFHACQALTQALNFYPGSDPDPNSGRNYCTKDAIDDAALDAALPSAAEARPIDLIGWRNLGSLLRALGRLEESERMLSAQVKRWPAAADREASSMSLGLTQEKLGDRERDRQAPQQFNYLPWRCSGKYDIPLKASDQYLSAEESYIAASKSNDPFINTQAHLNHLILATTGVTITRPDEALEIPIKIQNLASGRIRVYGRLQYAKSRACLQQLSQQPISWNDFTREIEMAIAEARAIGDSRAESAALGHLGELYELRIAHEKDRAKEEDLTRWKEEEEQAIGQALIIAEGMPKEGLQATELIYKWQWHIGRLLRDRGEKQQAIAAYEAAASSLEQIRRDLLGVNADAQFSFRDNVEPLYRELVDLLITESEATSVTQEQLQNILGRALSYIESLQLAELENFLQCNLLSGDRQQSESSRVRARISLLGEQLDAIFKLDPKAAFIYPILLEDRIAIVARTPDGQFQAHSKDISFARATATIDRLLNSLESPSSSIDVSQESKDLYNWLIAPFEEQLAVDDLFEESQIQTLVFVLDGPLRNLPMAVLYDDSKHQRYLLERYAITQVSSGIQILAAEQQRQAGALLAGLSIDANFEGKPKQLKALPKVAEEIEAISREIPRAYVLEDDKEDKELTLENLKRAIAAKPYSTIHIATHGQFSSDPNETFLLLYDGLLRAREFDRMLQDSPERLIELLVLSACETAKGDRRAALGLAGLALQAGARSTLATLWKVSDESTAMLMNHFYHYQEAKNSDLSKAEALRHAQLKLLENPERDDWKHPYFWAPYTLIGNWL